MTYTFDPTSGATRTLLSDLVLTNTFSSSRYGELVKAWLNDGVMDICRRLDLLKGYQVLAVTNGIVAQATLPFWRVDEVWTADGPAASTAAAFRDQARRWLEPIPYDSPALAGANDGQPCWYTVRRSPTAGRHSALEVAVHPSGASFVAIAGRQRPALMTADASTTGLDAELDDALVAYVKARCFRNEDDFELAASWQQEYMGQLGAYNTAPHSGPIVTPGTWEQTSPRSGGF